MHMFQRRILRTLAASMALGSLVACSPMSHAVVPAASPDNDPTMAAAEALSLYNWQLQEVLNFSAEPPSLTLPNKPEHNPVLRFHLNTPSNMWEGRLSVKLCNTLSSPYGLEGNKIDVGHGMSTMMACADTDLMKRENDMRKLLSTIEHWHMEPMMSPRATPHKHPAQPTLKLTLRDGSIWVLKGSPNDELRHGGAPERVFLEVAPDLMPCTPHDHDARGAAAKPCLRVRTITYNDQWIKQPPGEWREFRGQIEGFQHEAGYRKVLRLNHWPQRNVYVLDMVVETELVR